MPLQRAAVLCVLCCCLVTGTVPSLAQPPTSLAMALPSAGASWTEILQHAARGFKLPVGCTSDRLQLLDRDGAQITHAALLLPDIRSAVRCDAAPPVCPQALLSQHDDGVRRLMSGEYKEARDLLATVIEQCPGRPEFLNNIGEAHRVLGDMVCADTLPRCRE